MGRQIVKPRKLDCAQLTDSLTARPGTSQGVSR
ncbi:hypothetical protein STVIR_8743 [Streptomyces viridochromogenes Tue57]|uniref:Uncharacterized protein n=1 Tax=Streptomyces viridochromogenes Tue57 TaxID=1160705 RepID=L8P2A4_STRVR|nr:hypothetical protein STVIR_8743 [Streptomyces viridochromogenes Tue57]